MLPVSQWRIEGAEVGLVGSAGPLFDAEARA